MFTMFQLQHAQTSLHQGIHWLTMAQPEYLGGDGLAPDPGPADPDAGRWEDDGGPVAPDEA